MRISSVLEGWIVEANLTGTAKGSAIFVSPKFVTETPSTTKRTNELESLVILWFRSPGLG